MTLRRPRLVGTVEILSTVPTVDWALLGPGEYNKGQNCGSPWTAACLQMHLVFMKAGNACNHNNNPKEG
jgi:hypothetical protein